MRVLFPYPLEFGFFPDLYEYVTLLRKRGIEAFYVGVENKGIDAILPPYAMGLPNRNAQRKDFIRFVGQQIAAIRPDIVHSFHFRGCGVLPLLATKSAQKWIVDVRTIHVQTRKMEEYSNFWLRDRLTWLETQSYDHILALTKTIHQKLRPSIRPINIVPLGASFKRLNSTKKGLFREKIRGRLNIAKDDPVILYAGSLSPTRQIDKIVTGFSLMLTHFPDAKLLLVGGQPGYDVASDPLILPLMELTKELGISSNVLFTGRVPYSDIPMYQAASDVGVSYMPLGTRHQYQPPTKLIEYMMAGMVSASNQTPAVEGIIKDDINGIVFGESAEEIANGLYRSLDLLDPNDQELLLKLTTNARNAVLNRDWQIIVDEHLIPLYETLRG